MAGNRIHLSSLCARKTSGCLKIVTKLLVLSMSLIASAGAELPECLARYPEITEQLARWEQEATVEVRADIELFGTKPHVAAPSLAARAAAAKGAIGKLLAVLETAGPKTGRSMSRMVIVTPPEYAVRALTGIGEPAVPALIAMLESENKHARRMAIGALGGIRDRRAVEPVIVALGEPETRSPAVVALGNIGDPRAVEPICALLKDVRQADYYILRALGQLKDRRAIVPLLGVLGDYPGGGVFEQLMEGQTTRTLSGIDAGWRESADAKKAVKAYEALLLNAPDPQERVRAARALRELRDAGSVEPLMRVLENAASDVKDPTDIAALLQSVGSDLRVQTAWSLAAFGAPQSNELMLKVLKDRDPRVQSAAMHYLAKVKDRRCLETVASLVTNANRLVAFYTLDQIEPNWPKTELAKPVTERLLADRKNGFDRTVITFFQRSGNFDALVLALRSPGPYSRADAAGALGSLKDKRAIPYLVAASRDRDLTASSSAVFALEDLGAVEELLEIAGNPKHDGNQLAMYRLAWNKEKRVIPILLRALKDDREGVRNSALASLRLISGQKFGPEPAAWQEWYKQQEPK
jgi:HEAT repeat protein